MDMESTHKSGRRNLGGKEVITKERNLMIEDFMGYSRTINNASSLGVSATSSRIISMILANNRIPISFSRDRIHTQAFAIVKLFTNIENFDYN